MVGLPTALCVVLAFALKLNLPAIQTANYAVMPLQLLLMAPFVRLGGWIVSQTPRQSDSVRVLLHFSPANLAWHNLAWQLTGFAGQALLAWVVVAIPAVALLTAMLTLLFKRVPVLAAVEACEPAN